MQRWFIVLLALLLMLPSVAFADVIVEPDNGFFARHREECSHVRGRTYLADGPDGSLPMYTAPGGTRSKTVPNGEAFYCEWVYTDGSGSVWGFSDRHGLWTPLGHTLVQYDDGAFRAEYGDRIVPNSEGRSVPENTPIAMYGYPGAPDPFRMDMGGELIPEELYVDGQGRTWGSVGYYYGVRNKWVCLDDPSSESLGGEPKAPVPSGYALPRTLPSGSKTGLIAAVVGGVALVTAAAVLILFRKKRKA